MRQSEPQGFNAYSQRGATIIPRRGAHLDLNCPSDWQRHAVGSPLRLLKVLADIDPGLSLALWNALTISCAPGDLRIEAVRVDDGISDDTEQAGNAALEEFFRSLPSEIGGLDGLQAMLTQEAYLTGLIFVEAVPGVRGKGLKQVWPVDSLSIGFRRDPESGEARPYQRQFSPSGGATFNGYTELSTETCFWHAVHAQVDDPYGRAPFATAVREILADTALMKDLSDAMHMAAWPRLGFGFPFTEMHKTASELGLTGQPAADWVNERFQEAVTAWNGLNPDDAITFDKDGGLESVTPGVGFQAITGVLQFLRQRRTQALKSLPTLMGINDGSTQTYTTVEWAIYAKGVEAIRSYVAGVLVKVASLHLQLLGMPLKAEAKTNAIRTSDEYVDAQTLQMRAQTWLTLIDAGMASREEASRDLLGHEPFQDDDEYEAMRQRVQASAPVQQEEDEETVAVKA